jgi:hypothetical protein
MEKEEAHSVWSVRSHIRRHDDGSLDPQLDKLAGDNVGAEVGTKHIQVKQLLELWSLEIECGLMLGHARIGNKAINTASFIDNGVYRFLNALFVGDVGLDVLESLGIPLCQRLEFLARLDDVKREDDFGRVGETDFCNTQADTPVGTGNGNDFFCFLRA